MIISVDAEKTPDSIQHPFIVKAWKKVGIEGTYYNLLKNVYDRPITNIIKAIYDLSLANIITNRVKLKSFL
jgi:hypothetical protein